MKKLFVAISLILIWCLMLVSCNTNHVDTSLDSNINNTEPSTNNQDTLGTLAPNDDKDLNNQDILDTLVPNDEDFPFDNIVVERNGYDIIAAGKYYGNDFDSAKYYGSYYRIIDNYADFIELSQWGKQLGETVFDENFVLVLYLYTNCDVYYTHSEFNVLNQRGCFLNFNVNLSAGKPEITETWSVGGGVPDVEGYIPPKMEEHTIFFPIEKQETIYLLISKDEMPNNLPINGEIELNSEIIELE